jgi:hypothetical protein
MERPVGSFKSFIQTVPPNPTTWSDVSPLTPGAQKSSPLLMPSPLKRIDTDVNLTAWTAPTEWNPNPSSHPAPIDPASAHRECSPLIPEPSPSVCSRRTDSWSWPAGTSAFESTRRRSVYETDPGTKPRTRNSKNSPVYSPFNPVPTKSALHSHSGPGLQTYSVPPADVIYQTSNDSRRAKAYVSLGIMWPRETKTGCEYWSAARDDDDSTAQISRSVRGKRLPPLYRTSPLLDEECEDEELDDRLQLLSFSQDYHGVLTDQYLECRASRPRSSSLSIRPKGLTMCGCIPIPRFRLKTYEPMSESLAWRKSAKSRRKHNKSSLWTPRSQISREVRERSVERDIPRRFTKESPPAHRNPILNILSPTRSPETNTQRSTSIELAQTDKPLHISQGMASDSSSQGYRSVLFRLPRGFALVRLSAATTTQSEATNNYESIRHEAQRQKSSAVSEYPWRRSSWYHSSPPTSATTLEFPPPLPVHWTEDPLTPSVAPSLYQSSKTWLEELQDDALQDEEIGGRGLMGKARDVRDAWRRHQRETRHDKLKKSIRVLGLVDERSTVNGEK